MHNVIHEVKCCFLTLFCSFFFPQNIWKANHKTWYLHVSFLHSQLKKRHREQMYGFVDPNRFSHNAGKSQKIAKMLADAMKEAIEDQIFLAPYNSK